MVRLYVIAMASPVFIAPIITVGGFTPYSDILNFLVPVQVKLLSVGLYFNVVSRSVSRVVPAIVNLPIPLSR